MAFAGGTGTELDPYLVSTAEQLNDIRNYFTYYFKQINNIDLSSYTNWIPIGSYSIKFSGSYDGDNFNITNLTITNSTGTELGLFGVINSNCKIQNINISGSVNGYSYLGLLIGQIKGTYNQVTNCHSSGSVTGNNSIVGGLIGYIEDRNTILNCTSNVVVSCTDGYYVGGLIGYMDDYNTINNCNSINTVSGSDYVGGLIGFVYSGGTILKSFASGNVSSLGYAVGGFIGYAYDNYNISNCYCVGNIIGNNSVGGFAGYAGNAIISKCYSTGNVSATILGKGFVCEVNSVTINDCYFDSEKAGQIDSYATSKTTEEMKTQVTFADWDFTTIWKIGAGTNDGYPNFELIASGLDIHLITDTVLRQVEKIYVIIFNVTTQQKELKEVEKVTTITNTGLKYS